MMEKLFIFASESKLKISRFAFDILNQIYYRYFKRGKND